MFEPLHDGVASLGHGNGAYAAVESWARSFATFLDENMPDSSASGAIVANACLAERPDLRPPLDAQEGIDTAHGLGDEQYLQLCGARRSSSSAEPLGAAGSRGPPDAMEQREPDSARQVGQSSASRARPAQSLLRASGRPVREM